MKRNNLRLTEKIQRLKKQRNAVILVHNYQIPEVQDVADYIGDSLGLSRAASSTDADVIVFCGVYFMAETASILCPDKTVLMPDINAGCPMADMITAEQLREFKKEHPKAKVLAYVNTSAEVKAETDICCTSGNAVKVAETLKNSGEIIFVPDKYLANYVSSKVNVNLIPWNGYCPTHVKILPENILKQKKAHPKAEVIVHPECRPEVIAVADQALSTEGMCRYAKHSGADEIIVGTEIGMLYRLQSDNPAKRFYPATELAVCPSMKLTNLEKVLWCLEDMKYEVRVPENVRLKAISAIESMIKIRQKVAGTK
ncbi:MAG: quinolinate synthase NadA [Candidatus Omnitrophota bacterium]